MTKLRGRSVIVQDNNVERALRKVKKTLADQALLKKLY